MAPADEHSAVNGAVLHQAYQVMAYVGQTGGCRGLEGLSLDTLFANVVPKTATYAELGDKAGLLSLAAKPTER